jgi:hypothetical protein
VDLDHGASFTPFGIKQKFLMPQGSVLHQKKKEKKKKPFLLHQSKS